MPRGSPRTSVTEVMELVAKGWDDQSIADHIEVSLNHARRLRRQGGVVRQGGGFVPESTLISVRERAAEGWPVPEITTEYGVSREYVGKHASEWTQKNGLAWRRLQIWAMRKHPDLYQSIERMDIP